MSSIRLKNKLIIFIATACTLAIFCLATVHAFFAVKYEDEIISVCKKSGIDKELVFAIIKAESSFDCARVSDKGAIGLMQILPSTGEYVCERFFDGQSLDLYNPKENLVVGVSYLIYLYQKFELTETVIVAYNAGEGNVAKWLKNKTLSLNGKSLDYIPFEESRIYLKRVLFYKRIYEIIY